MIGWIVLLAITFAATDPAAVTKGGGGSLAVFLSAMSTSWVKVILIIAVDRPAVLRHELHDQLRRA